ncbi:MAG TPA: hypothetical protein VKR21_14665 [Solirubrobacteraceae bacterium]|nr:hypothetical protein [Solirubrobacteraceae bacterium]
MDRAADRRQLFTDVGTRTVACLSAARETLPRLVDKGLDLLAAHAEHGGDLGVGVVTQLKENECCALLGRQRLHVLEHFAQVLPPLSLIRRAIEAWPIHYFAVDGNCVAPGAPLRETAIASDGVKPRPERNVAVALPQRPVGRRERKLQRVFGLNPAAQHVRAESEHAARVSVVDSLEGRVVPGTHLRHKLLVALSEDQAAVDAFGCHRHMDSMSLREADCQ